MLEGTYFKGIPILGGYLLSNSITDGVKEEKVVMMEGRGQGVRQLWYT